MDGWMIRYFIVYPDSRLGTLPFLHLQSHTEIRQRQSCTYNCLLKHGFAIFSGNNDTLFYTDKFCEGTKFDKFSMNFKILLHIPLIHRTLSLTCENQSV